MDVGEDAARRDRDAAEELVQLLVVLDGERDVAGDDALLLVVAGGVASELEDLGLRMGGGGVWCVWGGEQGELEVGGVRRSLRSSTKRRCYYRKLTTRYSRTAAM